MRVSERAVVEASASVRLEIDRAAPARVREELVAFYRRGAVVEPPRRSADESHWHHRALVGWHVVACVAVAALVVAGAAGGWSRALTAVAFVCLGHELVDPVHGLVHFALDNYFSRTTPIVGGVVSGFLSHHDDPAVITRIQLARNVAPVIALALPVLAALLVLRPIDSLAGLALTSALGTFFAESGFAMEAHKYAHIGQERLPLLLGWLQRRGWLVSPAEHGKHHARKPGFEADYAAVSGKANRYLTSAVFRAAERAIFALTEALTGTGVEPRSWCDPAVRVRVRSTRRA